MPQTPLIHIAPKQTLAKKWADLLIFQFIMDGTLYRTPGDVSFRQPNHTGKPPLRSNFAAFMFIFFLLLGLL